MAEISSKLFKTGEDFLPWIKDGICAKIVK